MEFLKTKGVEINENLIFDQFVNLKKFLGTKDPPFFELECNEKMCCFFNSNTTLAGYSEILKMAQYIFAIPSSNANCERIFSLINAQWSKERNRLAVDTVKHLTIVKFNLKQFTCVEFSKYLLMPENSRLLEQIGSAEKYDKKEKGSED